MAYPKTELQERIDDLKSFLAGLDKDSMAGRSEWGINQLRKWTLKTVEDMESRINHVSRGDFYHPRMEFTPEAEIRLRECIHYVNLFQPDLADNLRNCFRYFTRNPKLKRVFMVDFARLSFYWQTYYWTGEKWEYDMNGGIIFHHDSGYWATHT